MYIRWMGAFITNGSISDGISFEMTRESAVACEHLQKGKSYIQHARIGLLVDPKAVYKRYSGDVYSHYTSNGCLHTGRKPYEAGSKSRHWEAFAKPVYTGIVIKNGSLETIKRAARKEILDACEQYHLPVYKLVKGSLIREI